jgi:hypothetical protein
LLVVLDCKSVTVFMILPCKSSILITGTLLNSGKLLKTIRPSLYSVFSCSFFGSIITLDNTFFKSQAISQGWYVLYLLISNIE